MPERLHHQYSSTFVCPGYPQANRRNTWHTGFTSIKPMTGASYRQLVVARRQTSNLA
ncbi:hypothetical protein O9929_18445 [Vibrio lentus]|nr:hypothetical protein [Vibrio lentus]